MTPLPCMASVDAFVAAPPAELAAAVLVHGLSHTVQRQGIDAYVEYPELMAAFARALAISEERPGSRRYQEAMATPPNDAVGDAVTEGILTAEQALCVARSWSSTGSLYVRLLRRGRHALAVGDPFTYLRS